MIAPSLPVLLALTASIAVAAPAGPCTDKPNFGSFAAQPTGFRGFKGFGDFGRWRGWGSYSFPGSFGPTGQPVAAPTPTSSVPAAEPTNVEQPDPTVEQPEPVAEQPSPVPSPAPSAVPEVSEPAPAPSSSAPAPVRTPAAAVAPAAVPPTVNAAVTPSSDADRYLAAHNTFRAQYGASALTWSTEAAAAAQKWANNCKFEHSQGAVGNFGENLSAGTGDAFNIEAAIKLWTDEAADYNPSNPQYSHFTQVVWKGTSQLGCAVAQCDGIFPSGKANFYVCEYSAPGNVIGQFAQNVGAFQG